MKFNWKSLIALALIIGAAYWAIDSSRTRDYTGSNFHFDVGTGPVTVTNKSDQPVTAQLITNGTRTFSVTSTIKGLPNTSAPSVTDTNAQVFDLPFPPGVSEFTVTRGTNVSLVTDKDTQLSAAVHSLTAAQTRTNIIVAVVIILAALFYISRMNDHRWIGPLRRQADAKEAARVQAEAAALDHGQGQSIRSYGDNRANL